MRCLATGIYGALDNVKINLESISDEDFVHEMEKATESIAKEAETFSTQILADLEKRCAKK